MTLPRFLLVAALLSAGASAQTSEAYLISWGSTNAYVVRNGTIVRQFARTGSADGPALAVQATVKLFGQANADIGREYSTSGVLLSGQYVNPGVVDCYDGATDGTHNWTISHNDFSNNFAVLITDANWSNLQIAFVPNRRSSGITYDATDGTLWVANNVGGCDRVQHYTTGGALLGEFAVNLTSGGGYGIALDPADQTLWLTGAFGTAGSIFQYSKAGAFLQQVNVPGLTTNILGIEFASLPSPSISTYCTAGTTTHGCVALISGTGTPSASAGSGFTIAASGVEGLQAGMIFYGVAGRTTQAWGPSSSFFCVKIPVQRTPVQNAGGTLAACDGTLSLDWNTFTSTTPSALGAPFGAGQIVNAQAWFHDPPSPKSTMLSNALEFTVQP